MDKIFLNGGGELPWQQRRKETFMSESSNNSAHASKNWATSKSSREDVPSGNNFGNKTAIQILDSGGPRRVKYVCATKNRVKRFEHKKQIKIVAKLHKSRKCI